MSSGRIVSFKRKLDGGNVATPHPPDPHWAIRKSNLRSALRGEAYLLLHVSHSKDQPDDVYEGESQGNGEWKPESQNSACEIYDKCKSALLETPFHRFSCSLTSCQRLRLKSGTRDQQPANISEQIDEAVDDYCRGCCFSECKFSQQCSSKWQYYDGEQQETICINEWRSRLVNQFHDGMMIHPGNENNPKAQEKCHQGR